MAAMLSRNALDGKNPVLPNGLTIREVVRCRARGCPCSDPLAAGQIENFIEDGKNNLESLQPHIPAPFALSPVNHPSRGPFPYIRIN